MSMRGLVQALLLLLVVACSDAETTSTNQAQVVCETDCGAINAAMCSAAGSTEDCMDNCVASYGKCPTEVKAVVDCGPEYSCDADGNPFPEGCDALRSAFQACFNN